MVEDCLALLTELTRVDGGGVIGNVCVKYSSQVILVGVTIIHSPVFQGTAMHPRKTIKPGLVHLVL